MYKLRPAVKEFIALAFTLGALGTAHALPSDRDQPVNIEADSAELSQQAGQTIYRGHVKLSQGSLKITADEIVISVSEGTLKTLVATGQQATLSQLIDPEKPIVAATANTINYDIAAESLLLEGNANIEHGESRVEGNRLEYFIKDEKVQAEERVRMTIQTDHSSGRSEWLKYLRRPI